MNWQPIEEFDGRGNTRALIYIPADYSQYQDTRVEDAYYCPRRNGWEIRGALGWVSKALVTHFCIVREPNGERMDGLEESC